MKQEMEGKVIVVGDNVDTDQIYPGRYLALTDPAEIGSHCLAGVDENIAASFPAGGIVVAGRNFGCGSSREHAPIALINMGASAVVAESFARIFFRNAVNLGLPPVICRGIRGRVTIVETGEEFPCEPMGEQAEKILEAGGIKPLMRARFGKKE